MCKNLFVLFIISIFLFCLSLTSAQTTGKSEADTFKATTLVTSKIEVSLTNEEKVIKHVEENLDRPINILNTVATLMGVLVALITIILFLAGGFGIFEYGKWKNIRKEAEESCDEAAKSVDRIKKLENEMRSIIERTARDAQEEFKHLISQTPHQPITETPSEELKEKLNEVIKRLELVEAFGIKLRPEDYSNRGVDFYFKAKYDLALEAFDKVIKIKPDSDAWCNRSAVLSKLDRFEEALKACNKAVEIDPRHTRAWDTLRMVLCKLDRFEEALEASNKAIGIEPDDAGLWASKALLLHSLDRYKEALEASNKAIDIKADYAVAWYNRACTYSLLGNEENTLIDLSKAIELDVKYKEMSKKDEDFKNLWNDEEFKKIVS